MNKPIPEEIKFAKKYTLSAELGKIKKQYSKICHQCGAELKRPAGSCQVCEFCGESGGCG